MPNLSYFIKTGQVTVEPLKNDVNPVESSQKTSPTVATINPPLPAVTCTSQATYLTGTTSNNHGVVANGWYDKDYCEVKNWHQSSKLCKHPRIFSKLKQENPEATTFVHSWWFSMYDEDIDYMITPRPQYLADGGKKPDCYTKPAQLRDELQGKLGAFPLNRFWGPTTSIWSTEWIAKSSIMVDQQYDPTFSLIYLPHLDYVLQKLGPDDTTGALENDLLELDLVLHNLLSHYLSKDANIVILSEYGIQPVNTPIHINQLLRREGLLEVRRENYGETLDCGASIAFAVADHQIANVYVNDLSKLSTVKQLLESHPDIDQVLDKKQQGKWYHPDRSGDLLCLAKPNAWFTYYYWLNQKDAPDFARTVAIHRKPGYDPTEMFFRHYNHPTLGFIWLLWKVFLVYVLHIRTIVDASPLEDASPLIRGSHGLNNCHEDYKGVFIGNKVVKSSMEASDVYSLLWKTLTE